MNVVTLSHFGLASPCVSGCHYTQYFVHMTPELCLFSRNCGSPATLRSARGQAESLRLHCRPLKSRSPPLLAVGRRRRSSPKQSSLPPNLTRDPLETRGGHWDAGPLPLLQGSVRIENRALPLNLPSECVVWREVSIGAALRLCGAE